MEVVVDRSSPTPIHLQIAQQVRELILKGAILEGARLPLTRRLARGLKVNRSTVVQAYNKLWSEGLIEGHVGRGTIVRPARGPEETPISPPPWGLIIAPRAESLQLEVQELIKLFAREDLISLAGGLPAPELYPVEAVSEIAKEVLAREGKTLLQWCPVEGYPPLRCLLAERVTELSPGEVLITSGSTQGLYLLSRVLIEPGDLVVVESPTYLGALQAFRAAGARLLGVPVKQEGMDLGMLENVLARTQPKFIYTLPTFQNPTGATLSLERRRKLLELAYRYRTPLIEDDPYSLLQYEGEALPSLKALDTHDYVIYLSTFSKVIFPGLRIGWLAAPSRLMEHLASAKHLLDLFTNPLAQAVVYQFCRRGLLQEHLLEVRAEYRKRRDTMIEALRQRCPRFDFAKPDGGYFIWPRLPRGIASRELLEEALKERVSFITGEIFHPDGRGQERIRLNFTSQPPEALAEGVRRIGLALRRLGRGTPKPGEREALTRPIV